MCCTISKTQSAHQLYYSKYVMIADTDTHAILSWLEHVDTSGDDGQRTRTHCPKESADRYGARE